MKIADVIGISAGIAIGPVYNYHSEDIVIEPCSCVDPDYEVERLNNALEEAKAQLDAVYEKTMHSAGKKDAEIFLAHSMILEDPELLDRVYSHIRNDMYSVEYAWYKAILDFEKMIASLGDSYFAERSADVKDVGQRVLRILLGSIIETDLKYPSVIVAEDLSPSDTVGFDKSKVLAFCTVKGGATSHVAILSKSMGIPAVVGIDQLMPEMVDGVQVVVDGTNGTLILDPDDFMVKKYEQRAVQYKQLYQQAFLAAKSPAKTKDGLRIEVVANIGSPKNAAEAIEFGAEGVGLLRTEFLFLDREFPPNEEEQYRVYKEILEYFGEKPVVARTLDIGGDKPASYLKIANELNPFLGLRGTRLALKREDVFHTQLRALLRAGAGYNLKIMFPMVGTLQEVLAVKEHVEECTFQIQKKGQDIARNVEIGIMVEIPSAAIMADVLADHIDFFSIGTNDLTQYALAVDRTNSLVADYADALDPSVLRLIDMVIKSAHKKGKWVGLCGELAGEPLAAPLLLGMHLDEFSMNARAIPFVKQELRRHDLTGAEEIAKKVLQLESATKVKEYLSTVTYHGKE